ncbi:hypothetical protein [Halobellus ruber]|uniref:Rubrerythrin-like domain-containing protein n=1 Tax=Halobellus ruber TaxID=2761102 RepID=A0A7J9SG97_9EURY|nr:hypothetical protein [Halobellus ruber]MBB6645413.1 hypothetical protein [Halobellus ruber]
MLGLRYLACHDCGTVYAVPDDLEACDRCGATELAGLSSDPGAEAYFSRGLRNTSGGADR